VLTVLLLLLPLSRVFAELDDPDLRKSSITGQAVKLKNLSPERFFETEFYESSSAADDCTAKGNIRTKQHMLHLLATHAAYHTH
jgi:hypothetical protein